MSKPLTVPVLTDARTTDTVAARGRKRPPGLSHRRAARAHSARRPSASQSPTGSTTKEEFPCHASSDYDKSHDEFHRPRRQGEFTKFLQQAILKKVDLAQTGHA